MIHRLLPRSFPTALLGLLFSALNVAQAESPRNAQIPAPAPALVLDMVHHNPGEAKFPTRFTDPALLRDWGFRGNVPREYVQSAITFESYDPAICPPGSAERAWVEEQARVIDRLVTSMADAGLTCYPFTDFIVLPKRLVNKYRAEICDAKGRIDVSRPKTKEILRAQIAGIFERFPDLGGLTVRHGETYLHDLPHHTGGNPILKGADSHVALIELLREEICVKRGKRLLYRTWDFGGLHDKPDYYLAVANRIEPHPLLAFSIKHQRGDFHRLSIFNPCLGLGRHPQIVEVQCQLEAYGKGAYPYYNGQGVIEGWEEYSRTMRDIPPERPRGLRDFVRDARYAGTWTWSRGGGWMGPYLPNEFWCELNTYVIARWAQDPTRSEAEVFEEFSRRVAGLNDAADIARLREIALLSASAVLRSQNSLVHPIDVWWNRDDTFADITGEMRKVRAAGLTDAFLAEKAEASATWRRIEGLAAELRVPDARRGEFIRVSCVYGRIKAELIEQMCRVMLLGLAAREKAMVDPAVATALARYDALWAEWKRLRADHPDTCPTIYTDRAFSFARGEPGHRPGMGAAIDTFRQP